MLWCLQYFNLNLWVLLSILTPDLQATALHGAVEVSKSDNVIFEMMKGIDQWHSLRNSLKNKENNSSCPICSTLYLPHKIMHCNNLTLQQLSYYNA